eukprot:TRINITY_DN72011_c0_g1_i1.p1 TRINITY_DN72011_c0_g1~~TRINITY_DN72011_c0_g1_i1.p1  ORF type:complete len:346 (+),score=64.04 TRINITY_DN72011_c0_g1_i1:133-1038(+)
MMVFNKLAIRAFPVSCTLVALQMAFSALAMLCCWNSLHIGSVSDVLRWSMVVPFFSGMLLTSILALEYAPMTLVITFRGLSPLVSLMVERFYPNPIQLSVPMIASVGVMVLGCGIYTIGMERKHIAGIGWAALNIFLAVGDRLLQRLMLAKDQSPVDISKTGITFLNNLFGMVPMVIAALLTGEYEAVPGALDALDLVGATWVAASCIVGLAICYTGIWAQSLISATSFLVLVNANKFFIIFLEAFVLRTKSIALPQILGAVITILGGISYGKAREAIEQQAKVPVEDVETQKEQQVPLKP